MIRKVASCPYCEHGVVAIDDHIPEFVFNPGHSSAPPCEHLAFASVGLFVCEPTERRVDRRCGRWLYERGEGLRSFAATDPLDDLQEYVDPLCCELLCDEDRPTGVEFVVDGGSAASPEQLEETGAHFFLEDAEHGKLAAVLDGWAIYSHAPEAVVQAIRAKAFA
jgi:hypothetical protein